MRRWGPGDRLAVWTYVQAGEEVAAGDPSVTDAERAAAGRETLEALRESILPENRSRAAAQYAADALPEGEDVMRVWRPRDPAGLRDRLGSAQTLAVWAEDDVLDMLWRGQASEVQLAGGVQPRMWPVEGTDDLWEASLRIRRLDEALISVMVMPRPADGDWPAQLTERFVWHGPAAPAAPADEPLRGTVTEYTLDSAALRGPRQVTVYRPPGSARLAGCVLADGEATRSFAAVLDGAITAGAVPPVLLVGVHNAAERARSWPDRRSQEYLPGINRRRFDAHMRFVADEVVGWAGEQFGPVEGPWISSGFSSGAAWAIAAARRGPEVFGAVAAFSAGMVPKRISGQLRSARVRQYLAAGTLEPPFRRATREWADRLARAGLPCRHEEWVGGHDPLWWERQLPVALAWLLSPS
jgi:enterochelin esterase-like enzyme